MALLAAARAISSVTWRIDRAAADDLAADAQPLAQLDVFGADLRQVLGQFLAAADVLDGHGHGVGHGQGEFQIVGIGRQLVAWSSRGGSGRTSSARGGPGRRSRWWREFRPGCRGCPGCCRPSRCGPARPRPRASRWRPESSRRDGSGAARSCARRRSPGPRRAARPGSRGAPAAPRPASVCVPSARPVRASSASAATSGALANSKARRQSFAAARPIFETPLSSSSPGDEKLRLPAAMRDRRRLAGGQHAGSSSVGGSLRSAPYPATMRRTPAAARRKTRRTACGRRPVACGRCGSCRRASTASRRGPLALPTIVPLRLSRSRSVHCPPDMNTSTWLRLQRSSLMTIWFVGARPIVHRLSRHEPEDVAPLRAFANDQIGQLRHSIAPLWRDCK